MPLKTAMAPLAGNGLLEVMSSFKVTAKQKGLTLTYRENLHILARRPNSFRAELSAIDQDGITQPKALVVSDGKRVWTYRPGQRAYSVMTRSAFEATGDDVVAEGLAAGTFFIGDGHDAAKGFGNLSKEDSGAMLEGMAQGGMIVASEAQSLNGVDYTVYHLRLPKDKLAYLLYMNPQTNTLKRVDLAGTFDGMQIAFEETLTSITVPASAPPNTFTWTPPPGVKKLSKLEVSPF